MVRVVVRQAWLVWTDSRREFDVHVGVPVPGRNSPRWCVSGPVRRPVGDLMGSAETPTNTVFWNYWNYWFAVDGYAVSEPSPSRSLPRDRVRQASAPSTAASRSGMMLADASRAPPSSCTASTRLEK